MYYCSSCFTHTELFSSICPIHIKQRDYIVQGGYIRKAVWFCSKHIKRDRTSAIQLQRSPWLLWCYLQISMDMSIFHNMRLSHLLVYWNLEEACYLSLPLDIGDKATALFSDLKFLTTTSRCYELWNIPFNFIWIQNTE